MDIQKGTNIFCLIVGLALLIFGLLAMFGFIKDVRIAKSLILIIPGIIITLWSAISLKNSK